MSSPTFTLRLPRALRVEIEAYQHAHQVEGTAEAIKRLITCALAKPENSSKRRGLASWCWR